MKKNILLFSISLILGAIIGLVFNYYITSEIIVSYFAGSQRLYTVVAIICLILQVFAFTAIIYFILARQFPKPFLYILSICYFMVMIILLFGRPVMGVNYNFNILELFNIDFAATNVFNFLLFLPIGYFIRKKKILFTIIFSIVLVLGIEFMQLVTGRGIFDITDIIIDVLAIIIGYLIFNKIFVHQR